MPTTLKPRELEEGLTLQRVLGRGGFSTVYRAVWSRPGCSTPETVSVKTLLPKYCDAGSVHWQQFVAEAGFMFHCNHPNVLKCHGLLLLPSKLPGLKDSYDGPVLAMVLDYIKGGTLLQLLTTQMIEPHSKAYSLREGLGALADVAAGLSHLHERRPAVLHHDIKPGNILLQWPDKGAAGGAKQPLTAQIADFGLHVVLDDNRPVLLRRSGSVRGMRHSLKSAESLSTLDSNVFYSLASFTGSPLAGGAAADGGPPGGGFNRSPSQLSLCGGRPPLALAKSKKNLAGEIAAATAGANGRGGECVLTTVEPRSQLGSGGGMAAALACELGGVGGGSFSGIMGLRGSSMPGIQGVRQGGALSRPGSPGLLPEQRVLQIRTNSVVGPSTSGAEDGPAVSDAIPVSMGHLLDGPVKAGTPRGHSPPPPAVPASFIMSAAGSPADTEHGGSGDLTGCKEGAAAVGAAACITETVVDIDGDVAEWVFELTDDTGSLVYMAPEVKLKVPYNTKADVYSFGVMMYEVLGRTLLAKTCIGDSKIRNAEDFVKHVAGGWRPERPRALAPELWRLVEGCWHSDPNQRPAMAAVAAQLRLLQEELAPEDGGSSPGCGCTIS